MHRVLHLLGRQPDIQTEQSSAALARRIGDDFRITSRAIGAGKDYRNRVLAVLALRRELRANFDLVHAWDDRALAVAAFAGAPNIVFTPAAESMRIVSRWTHQRLARANVQIVCQSIAELEAWVKAGWKSDRCSVIRPGLEAQSSAVARNGSLRSELGFSEHDYVLLAPGESTRIAGHREAVWAAAILHMLDPKYKILFSGRGEQAEASAKLVEKTLGPGLMTMAEQKLGRCVNTDELAAVCDVVVVVPEGPIAALPIATCMEQGLPIVASPSPWMAEMLSDGINALVVARRSPRSIAQRILELREDPKLEAAIRAGARKSADELFGMQRFAQEYREIYRRAIAGN